MDTATYNTKATDIIQSWMDAHCEALTVCRSPYEQVLIIPENSLDKYFEQFKTHAIHAPTDTPIECECIGEGYYCYATLTYGGYLFYFCDKRK